MEITPFGNGTHSIAVGLKDLEEHLANPQYFYKLKGAIIAIHHGIETLLKDVLFQRNPVFILGEKCSIKQVIECYKNFYAATNNFLFGDEFTISPIDALVRTYDLRIGEINVPDYEALKDSYDKLNTLRNRLQHFAINTDGQAVIKILGILTPKFAHYIESCYKLPVLDNFMIPHMPMAGMEPLFERRESFSDALKRFNPNSINFIEQLRQTYDVLLRQAIDEFKGTIAYGSTFRFKIESRGNSLPSSSHPDIDMSGWINMSLIGFRNSTKGFAPDYDGNCYQVDRKIGPLTEKQIDEDTIEIEQRANFNVTVDVEHPDKVINLLAQQEYLKFLRGGKLSISVDVKYRAEIPCFKDTDMFGTGKLSELTGTINIDFSLGFFGENSGGSVRLVQALEINSKNSKLHARAFSKQNVDIQESLAIDLIFEGSGDINCKKIK